MNPVGDVYDAMGERPKVSAPVDVLAVIDALAKFIGDQTETYDEGATALLTNAEQARAAVAELIEADRELDHAMARRIAVGNRITSGSRSHDDFREQASAGHAYDRAVDRRRAALARIGGAK